MREIIWKARDLLAQHISFVMATITFKHGSAPREVGATMLVTADGLHAGTIGGGEEEYQAIQHAQKVLETGQSDLVPYEMTRSDAAKLGLVCGSHNRVHFQYVPGTDDQAAAYFTQMAESVENHEVYWLFDLQADHGISMKVDGKIYPFSRDGALPAAEELFQVKIKKPMKVYIFGGGHIAKATAALLHFLKLEVTVVDDRPEYLTPEEFPQVNRLLHSLENLSDLPIGNSDYVCVMTRGHANDIQVLKGILPKDPYYVGIVGNKMKAEKYPQHFQGTPLYEVSQKKVHLPVGLPIRALTPEEIAVSIAGEIILSYRSNC